VVIAVSVGGKQTWTSPFRARRRERSGAGLMGPL
jgi:hypothetical protein